MNLIIVKSSDVYIHHVAKDAWLLNVTADMDTFDHVYLINKITGQTVRNTHLIGMTEEEFKELNPKLHAAVQLAMTTSNGHFIYAEKTI